ncbi:predicted membrane protein [Serpentinimonas maccroryi]|uniref:Predicted membrane protein n=1 Tax=Serpentinimonas maccroryi TaxID=1458426 RepID=A0A060NVR9_9BURK|nr:DoxX family protein [Serpentinimonas maccroryi]BAO83004.1 predicted membrane protein [Serpentinimonas maccroryi]
MHMNTQARATHLNTHAITDSLERWISHALIALACRFGLAGIFWFSGRTKVDGWLQVNESALLLFEHEFALPLIPPLWAAHLATYAEHLLPLLLVLGLGTRWAALGLLCMTAVIQFWVYPDAWPTHLTWAAALLYLLGRGAGRYSLDHWLWGRGLRG